MAKRLNYDRLRELGTRLRKWREAAEMTQAEAAKAVGCNHQSQWSEWERGTRCPSSDAITAIEALTGRVIKVADWADVEETLRPTGTG